MFLGRNAAFLITLLFFESHSLSTVTGIAATCRGNLSAALITAFVQYIAISAVGFVLLILSCISVNLALVTLICSLQDRFILKNTPRYLVACSMFVECIISSPTHCCQLVVHASVDSFISSSVASPYALAFILFSDSVTLSLLCSACSLPSSPACMSFFHFMIITFTLTRVSFVGCSVTGCSFPGSSMSMHPPSYLLSWSIMSACSFSHLCLSFICLAFGMMSSPDGHFGSSHAAYSLPSLLLSC